VNRPARKLQHLERKIALKQSRKRAGAKTKTWKKFATQYKAIADQAG
jgi:hypothetical protein